MKRPSSGLLTVASGLSRIVRSRGAVLGLPRPVVQMLILAAVVAVSVWLRPFVHPPVRPEGPRATVLRPDGQPLVGARVLTAEPNKPAVLNPGKKEPTALGQRIPLTGLDGSFPIPSLEGPFPFAVGILGDDCYALTIKSAFAASPTVRAQPYGRIEGQFFVGSKAVPGATLQLSGFLHADSTMYCTVHVDLMTTTDDEGRFVFERVVPAPNLRVRPYDPSARRQRTWRLGDPVHVDPGETTRATIGGRGRPVIGRVEPPEGWKQQVAFGEPSSVAIETNSPATPYPPEHFRGRTVKDYRDRSVWEDRWKKSPEGIAYRDRRLEARGPLSRDGSFRFEDLPADDYRLTIEAFEEWDGRRTPEAFARLYLEFAIPPMPGGRSDQLLNLGTLRLRIRTVPKVGEPAPEFHVRAIDGNPIALNDYRGRYLLLDFGVLWDEQCRFQIARLNEMQQEFGDDDRFAILSLVMAADDEETRAFIAGKGQPWPQAIIGPLSNPTASAYGIEGNAIQGNNPGNIPGTILIGPDGKIVARDLQYDKIAEAIDQALVQADG